MDVANQNVLVCGMARSGIAAALLLKSIGANVTLQDIKTEVGDVSALEAAGIKLYLGKNPDDILDGQDLLVLSPGIPSDLPFVQAALAKEIPVISEVELASRLCPCPLAAITGTNGKTTTTTLVGEMLKTEYPGAVAVGNIGVPFSEKIPALTEDDYVVAEISSFQMEASPTFHPYLSAVLNITPDHLNRHKTLDTYIAMKERIFANQTPEDICILNAEDPFCRAMAEKCRAQVFFFSSRRILEKGIYLKDGGIVVDWGAFQADVLPLSELKILGTHNHENVMAAVAMSLCAGVPLDKIRKVLRSFMGVAHRIEYVGTIDGVDYYNDSKGTNPDAAIQAVRAMIKPTVLIGGGYDKDADFAPWIAEFPGKIKHLVLLGQTAEKIESACRAQGFTATTRVETFEEAVNACKALAVPGDAVLLSPACASWGMFDNYEQRGDLFRTLVCRK